MKLTDRQKKLAAVGVGGLLFLVFMLARSRNAENTAAQGPGVPVAVPGGAPQADLSGDSSGFLGGLSNDVTGGLSGVQTGLDTVASNQGILYDQGTDFAGQLGAITTGQATTQASIDTLATGLSALSDRIPATNGTPGPTATPTAAASPAKKSAKAKAAVKPKTVVKGGGVYHFYDTDPKKKGYERKVFVRHATAARTPSKKPTSKPSATGTGGARPHTKAKSRRRTR